MLISRRLEGVVSGDDGQRPSAGDRLRRGNRAWIWLWIGIGPWTGSGIGSRHGWRVRERLRAGIDAGDGT
jgi:hypothetical protein